MSGSFKESVNYIFAVAGIVILFAAAVFLFNGKTVTLVVEGKSEKVRTHAVTVGQLMQLEEVPLSETSRLSHDWNHFLKHGDKIVVKQVIPVVLETAGGAEEIYTCSSSVGELLDERGIEVDEDDILEPGAWEELCPGMKVKVVRQDIKTLNKYVEIPQETVVRNNSDLAPGERKVVQKGEPGLKKETWEVVYRGNEEFERNIVEEKIVREPVEMVVQVGNQSLASRGGDIPAHSQKMEMTATAYTYTGYNTCTGVPPRRGVVAVDSRVIPMGTRLYVENYGYCTALDQGGDIKGNRIDLFMETRSQALQWGKRQVTVYVLE